MKVMVVLLFIVIRFHIDLPDCIPSSKSCSITASILKPNCAAMSLVALPVWFLPAVPYANSGPA